MVDVRFSSVVLPAVVVSLVAVLGCEPSKPQGDAAGSDTRASNTTGAKLTSGPSANGKSADVPPAPLSVREGQALFRSPLSPVLYIADEDDSRLHRVTISKALSTLPPLKDVESDDAPPVSFGKANETVVKLPGHPAQVLATGGKVFVTVRDPGLLMVFSDEATPKLINQVSLPYDAWGMALSADAKTAYVSSGWSHQLSKIDLVAMKVSWSVNVEREPRGVTTTADGKSVYVSHLMGRALTRVDVNGKPSVEHVDLPPAPLRTFANETTVGASLGYAAIIGPDERRLFVGRHALGALWAWQGVGTVDVLSLATGKPVAPERGGRPWGQLTAGELKMAGVWDHGGSLGVSSGELFQPRAMVYRKKTRQLLVALEGLVRLAEVDAMSIAPGLSVNRYYRLGGLAPREPTKIQIPPHCGAPSGIALSDDEGIAWVYCRTTDNLVAVRLTDDGQRALRKEVTYIEDFAFREKLSPWGPFAYAKLDVSETDEKLALGRRLFFDALEPVISGAMSCAGCHPDGRDDGHVWREGKNKYETFSKFKAGPSLATHNFSSEPDPFGYARQTPMLAGRVNADGPYGWHGESPTLIHRIKVGFQLHRKTPHLTDGATLRARAEPIAHYLREGLIPPPRIDRPLSEDEQKGKAIFRSARADCAECHLPQKEFTDRDNWQLTGFRTPKYFDPDPVKQYKVPSLRYVAHTPPYYHDGSEPTLDSLMAHLHNRMGKTNHLSKEQKAQLVAYLKTL